MAGFEVIKDIDDKGLKKLPIASTAYTANDLLELTAGSTTWAAVTSSSNYFSRKAIAQETVTSSATEILCYELSGTETVRAESANNGNTAHNGDRMLATDSNTVNNTGTDNTSQNVIFVQDGIAGAVADKRLIGRIIVGPSVDPDAT